MSLTPGTRIGPYEVTAQIGVGGMGEVYRATDINLARQVAIKVLPEAVAHDAERLARFDREAKTLAALNHPNIAHIYGVEKSGSATALVMELVEGPTLADQIARGPIPVDDALPIAKQIAEALEAAHELGIIHRDLKPANIKVRDDGTVKVLDFGLAKVLEPVGTAAPSASQSPTITTPAMTQAGMILGTAAYMSPEQAKGRAVDKRADIWAFGAVLFEMLAGRRAFEGEDVVDTLGAVARLDPDWTRMPATAPAILRTLVRRCLEKDRSRRVTNMSAVLFLMRELPALPDASMPSAAGARSVWSRVIALAAVGGLAAAAAGTLAWMLKPSPPLLVTRSRFVLPDASQPDGQQFTGATRQMVAISPDGSQIAYVANFRLFLRPLSDLAARAIQGTESTGGLRSPNTPVFSPDGRSVAYWAEGAIRKVAVGGGAPVTLCQSDVVFGMSWGEDGIVYGVADKGIMRVSANGGVPQQLVKVEGNELASSPQMLPDGRAVVFTLTAGSEPERWDTARIVAQDVESGSRKVLLEGGSHASYVPTGHLVYVLGGVLFAVPFDVARLEVIGGAVPVVEGVRRGVGLRGTEPAQYSFSKTGSLVLVPGPATMAETSDVLLLNRQGGTRKLSLPSDAYRSIRVSPDGRQLTFDTDDGKEANVWVYDLSETLAPRRLTYGGANRVPIWSADGQYIVFQSDREGDQGLYRQRADGTGTAERLTKSDKGVAHVPESSSPHGDGFLFSVVEGATVSLWTYSLKDRQATRFGDAQSTNAFNAAFSPDGRWVAYTLRGLSAANIYVEPFPATGSKYQVTTQNGHHPVWLPDGRGLSYRVGNSNQMLIAVTRTVGFLPGNPVPALSEGLPLTLSPDWFSYDITRDGSAFVVVAPPSGESRPADEIHIVQNWFEELKRLVPSE